MKFEVLKRCQYGVYSGFENEYCDCDNPAEYVVWWREDRKDKLYVCQKHMAYIEECEIEESTHETTR